MSNVVFSARPTQTGPARHYKVTDVQYRQLKQFTKYYNRNI